MDRVTIKYSTLVEVLKHHLGDVIIDEALKVGEIDVVDDFSGKIVDKISLKKSNQQE